MKAAIRHFKYWHRLYIALAVVWCARFAVPAAFQGASSQWGQEIYAWVAKFEDLLSFLRFI
ncbi:hypothetical protein VSS37_03250 [Candidatus Thiothrix sp. Deng01]|uniref:Uncharacterized protein n=1 Tax=Candidatus Thiothrix phosphatis TaxID=3112415 RepID=A0ABU6CTS3_9GAMM|nr:hypothetical protein [Candidatus Thiothrix sp. Deng01]MEB4589986.1 hypothetical protein [Candidatus Thiothrix sp. Deng01]